MNPYFVKKEHWGEVQMQYQHLTEALLSGQFHIMQEPAEELRTMHNPYDMNKRNEIEKQTLALSREDEVFTLWDYAYYNGRYYVYFGVVPVLLFYLPHYVVFGYHISNRSVHLFCALFIMIAMVRLMQLVRRKFFRTVDYPFWFAIRFWCELQSDGE